jgi:hypothetical protein
MRYGGEYENQFGIADVEMDQRQQQYGKGLKVFQMNWGVITTPGY